MSRPPPPSGEGPGASEAADDVPYVDTLVREYLLYRGARARSPRSTPSAARARRSTADRVAELIFGRHVPRLDAVGLSRTLGLLRDRYFSRLDASFAPATAELETSIARLFVVTAAKARRKDKIAELFEAEGERLVAAGGDHELYRWFAVPYVKRPSSDPRFAPYFEDAWADAVVASARNFLSVALRGAPTSSCSASAPRDANARGSNPRVAKLGAGGGAVTRKRASLDNDVPRRGSDRERLGRRRPRRRRCTKRARRRFGSASPRSGSAGFRVGSKALSTPTKALLTLRSSFRHRDRIGTK